MVTEDEARTLLARAADTIDVDDRSPAPLAGLPEPGRRRWPVAVAAAAVAAVIAGGLLVSGQLGDDAPPADDPADRTVEREHEFADDELPSLIGYSEVEARELLGTKGLEVDVQRRRTCDPAGLVYSSDPGPGARVSAGDRVRIAVNVPMPGADCVSNAPIWELFRFARGLGPLPELGRGVTLWVGDVTGRWLSAEDAQDPDSWILCAAGECHSALGALEQMLSRPQRATRGDEAASTYPVVEGLGMRRDRALQDACVISPEPSGGTPGTGRTPTWVYVTHPMDGTSICPPMPLIQVEWDEQGRIATVGLPLPTEAETIDEDELGQSMDRASSAARFVAWSRDEAPPPAFADEVRFLVDGEAPFGAPTRVQDPTDPEQWAACSGLPAGRCGLDPRWVLDHHEGPVAQSRTRATCPDGGTVPEQLAAATDTDLVRLDQPEPTTCAESWAVELWIDDEGAIYAVNLAVAAP